MGSAPYSIRIRLTACRTSGNGVKSGSARGGSSRTFSSVPRSTVATMLASRVEPHALGKRGHDSKRRLNGPPSAIPRIRAIRERAQSCLRHARAHPRAGAVGVGRLQRPGPPTRSGSSTTSVTNCGLGRRSWVRSLVVWATSAVALRTALLPRWCGWLGILVGIILLFAIFFIPAFVYWGWILFVLGLLVWRPATTRVPAA